MTDRRTSPTPSSSSHAHRPAQPSALRQSHTPASAEQNDDATGLGGDGQFSPPESPPMSPEPAASPRPFVPVTSMGGMFAASESTPLIPDASRQRRSSVNPAHPGVCTHGTFSPRASTPEGRSGALEDDTDDDSETPGSGTTIAALDKVISHVVGHDDWKGWFKKTMRTRKMGQSSELAERAGFRDTPLM